jgi:hypothetical protein
MHTHIHYATVQAVMNLGYLSLYPSLFPTPEARSKAIVPQQVHVCIITFVPDV